MTVKLTKREKSIISLVNQGCTNCEIGPIMGTTKHVIKNYLLVIYDKTGMSSRLELALWWESHKEQYV